MNLLDLDDQTVFPGPSLIQLWESPEAHLNWPLPLSQMEHRPWNPEDLPSRYGAMKSLLTPQWHYIAHDAFGVEVYHWQEDFQELNNLAATPEGQSIIDWFKRVSQFSLVSR
jgi:hypothetical protein